MGQEEPYALEQELGRLGGRRVALGVLDMVLSSAEWTHRRVEQVEIITDSHAIRRVSLDLTIPKPCASQTTWFDGRSYPLVPVDVLAKRPLQQFSIVGADGHPLSTLTRRQNGEVAWKGMTALADDALKAAGQGPVPDWALGLLKSVAQDSETDARAALQQLESRAEEDPVAETLLGDAGLRAAAEMLSANFLLIAMCDTPAGTRTLIKYSHEQSLLTASNDQRSTWGRFQERIGVTPTTLEFPVPSFTDCETFHFEASAPGGIELVDIVLGDESRTEDDKVDPKWTLGYRRVLEENPHRAHLSTSRTSDPQASQWEFEEPRVSVSLRVERNGWLRSSALASVLVAWFFAASLWWVVHLDDGASRLCTVVGGTASGRPLVGMLVSCLGGTGLSTDPAAFTVALLGVISLAVIRAGEHAYTARLLRPLRILALLSAVLPIAGAWLLVFPGPGSLLAVGWIALTAVAVLLSVALVLVWRLPAPSE